MIGSKNPKLAKFCLISMKKIRLGLSIQKIEIKKIIKFSQNVNSSYKYLTTS